MVAQFEVVYCPLLLLVVGIIHIGIWLAETEDSYWLTKIYIYTKRNWIWTEKTCIGGSHVTLWTCTIRKSTCDVTYGNCNYVIIVQFLRFARKWSYNNAFHLSRRLWLVLELDESDNGIHSHVLYHFQFQNMSNCAIIDWFIFYSILTNYVSFHSTNMLRNCPTVKFHIGVMWPGVIWGQYQTYCVQIN